jgi:hypothetical protein
VRPARLERATFWFVVNQSWLNLIRPALASEHVEVYVFMGCEIDNRIEIIAGCAKCDLLAIRDETACGCANRLWQTALDANPAPRRGAFKGAAVRARIDFGRE